MINFYDIAYGIGVGIASPVWMLRTKSRTKVLRAFRERMGHVSPRVDDSPAIMIHAVSLGEINATRALVDRLLTSRPDLRITVSTTTDTGFSRGQALYANHPRVSLIRYPLDFSNANARVLDAIKPVVVVLMELELWPNFLRECKARGIAVVLANGRLTETSFGKYRLIKPVMRTMLRRVAKLCVQDETYARRFLALGASQDQLTITGTMKFDTAQIADRVDGDESLAKELGLRFDNELIWVCGSTGPGEEETLLRVYRSLRDSITNLRLVIVPRKPERFDEVAAMIQAKAFELTRRSKPAALPRDSAVILGDTMGELRKFYSLASVVFVGRTLVDLGSRQHGSDMIEPAALGKPVIVGPFTGNFAEVVRRFKESEAIVEVPDESALKPVLLALLKNADEARALGERARRAVASGQGATARHAEMILNLLTPTRIPTARG